MPKLLLRVCLLAVVALAITAGSAAAQNLNVTKTTDTSDGVCDADCSLREAINAANATALEDTVVVPAGTYTLTLAGSGNDTGTSGDLDLGVTNPSLPRAITIQGAGVGQTIVDAGGIDRVFHLLRGMTATITGMTAKGGAVPTNYGGIVDTRIDAFLTLDHVEVTGGAAQTGGGINISTGSIATIRDSRIAGNVVTSGGGGIENSGTTTLLRDQITGNHADGYRGGGIDHLAGTLTMTDSELSANSADIGGGIAVENGGPATLAGVAIVGNTAGGDGAGLFNQYQTNVTNTTIAGNVVTQPAGEGGGADFEGPATLRNVTVAGNSAATAAGLRTVAALTLQNTIVVGPCPAVGPGAIASAGNNLTDGTTCHLTGPGDLATASFGLGPLAANGGLTRTLALLPGSPAVDAANAGACAATDQRGAPRPQGAGCDIGAYEATPVPPATTPPVITPPADTLAPKLTLSVTKTTLKALRKTGRLKVRATVSEAAKIALTLKLGTRTLGKASQTAKAAGSVTVAIKLSKSARKRLTKATLKLTGQATDPSGNVGAGRASAKLK